MNGLNSHEVEYRISNGMINNENIKNSRSLKTILLSNVITLFNLIHLVLFIFVMTTGSINNAMFVISIIFNMFISIYQEIKAKRIIDKLTIANVSRVNVLRGGKLVSILPSEIVLDDLLYLKAGDNLVVDAVVVNTDSCEVDESIITGESDAIIKNNGDKSLYLDNYYKKELVFERTKILYNRFPDFPAMFVLFSGFLSFLIHFRSHQTKDLLRLLSHLMLMYHPAQNQR